MSGVCLGSLDSPAVKRLTDAGAAVRFLPPDWLLVNRQGALVARKIDLARETVSGDAVPIAEGLAALSVSANDLFAYRASGANRRQLIWFDRTGSPVGTLGDADYTFESPELSPDGQRRRRAAAVAA